MAKYPYALQLYTVRDRIEPDPAGALVQVKEAGFDHVELAGMAGKSAGEFKALLDAAGLTAISMHEGIDSIAGDVDRVIAAAKNFALKFVVVPWLGSEVCPDKEAWLKTIRLMDEAGAKFREAGIQLCYHNHAHEFEKVEGEVIFDLIYENSAPENLAVQLDTCWASVGGSDPVALMRQYTGRLPLVHVKDYLPGPPPALTEAGKGCMDWAAVLPAGQEAGAQWFIIEQDDNFAVDSIDSARTGAAFMAAQ